MESLISAEKRLLNLETHGRALKVFCC